MFVDCRASPNVRHFFDSKLGWVDEYGSDSVIVLPNISFVVKRQSGVEVGSTRRLGFLRSRLRNKR